MLRFLLASGPTEEPIDPVRFISNRSTGAMGRHLAGEIRRRGHRLNWIECPKKARTALELQKALKKALPKSDVLIMAAAVADFRPASPSASKAKKENFSSIRLKKNPDILSSLKSLKKKGQSFIGFGVESSALLKKGRRKMVQKGLEIIVMQKANARVSPFGDKSVEAWLLDRRGRQKRYARIGKMALARQLVRLAEQLQSA